VQGDAEEGGTPEARCEDGQGSGFGCCVSTRDGAVMTVLRQRLIDDGCFPTPWLLLRDGRTILRRAQEWLSKGSIDWRGAFLLLRNGVSQSTIAGVAIEALTRCFMHSESIYDTKEAPCTCLYRDVGDVE
tara:strand:- start:4131 stop:4520 length:390 start_codon:yes stop_codon:yes gene_type:complete